MAQVQTVRGAVDTAELGPVLMHEHVFVLDEELRMNYPASWDEEQRIADAVRKLTELRSRGITTIVDPTVLGLGRSLPRVMRVNDLVDIHIIPATGIYTYHDVPFYFRNRPYKPSSGRPDPMTELFVADLTEGIGDTGVRAAFLKCAIDTEGMTPGVERVMRAVAAAYRRTGAPITVHTSVANRSGLLAQQLFAAEGVDLTKVVIGHVGDTTDLDYLGALADAGSLLGMDRFGVDTLLPFADRVDTVVELVRQGYAEKIVLAHDAACYIDWFRAGQRERFAPRWHYTHISDDVLPTLRERGVTDKQIDTMLVDNPRRYFEPA